MTTGRHTSPSRRLFYPILGALANAQITLTKVPLPLFPTLDAVKKTPNGVIFVYEERKGRKVPARHVDAAIAAGTTREAIGR
jgi:hypothetical protein